VLPTKTQPPQKRTCNQQRTAKDVDRRWFDERDSAQKPDKPEEARDPLFEHPGKT